MDVTDYKHVVLGLFFLKYLADAFDECRETLRHEIGADAIASEWADELLESPDRYIENGMFWIPPEARWRYLRERRSQPEIGELIDSAMVLIELGNPGLVGTLPKVYARVSLDARRFGELIELISGIGSGEIGRHEKDILGRVYEYLLGQFASAEGKRGGEFYTPSSVTQLIVEMIEPRSGRVYDPCCGSGGMFVQAQRFIEAHGGHGDEIGIYGQEVNGTTWQLAQMNLAIRGVGANLGPRGGDSFREDLHPDLKADYILANPPFNISHWGGGDQSSYDARWRYGVPPPGNANFAWLQHILSHLSPCGVAGVVLANGSVSTQHSEEAEIRRRMIEADLVECIVALPGQLFYSTRVPATLWFLNRDKSSDGAGDRRDRRNETLFIDARQLGVMASPTRRHLTDDDVARIADTYRAWRGKPGADGYVDVPGFCASATTERIAGHRYVLVPGLYVGAEGESLEKIHARHGLCVRVSLQGSRAGFLGQTRRAPSFTTVIPAGHDVAAWRAARYGRLGWPPEITMAPDAPVRSRIDPVLEELENEIRQTMKDAGWPTSRLINFVENAVYLRSQKSPERTAKIAEYLDEERLVLPIEPSFDAAYGTVRETVIANRCLLVSLLPGINGCFLAAWLNSDTGRRVRVAAMTEPGRSPRTMSSGELLRFLDDLIMPVPDLDVQASIADAAVMLHRVRQQSAQLIAELWQAPSRVAEIQSATRQWLDYAASLR
jgi:type I restriction enzyme M protein